MMQGLLIRGVRAYRLLLSPWLGSACRFEPTCSVYALEALQTHGAANGSYLTVSRLLRCHPWCLGGQDPVPIKPVLFSQLLPSSNPGRNLHE
jgi:putative membrane protein insertion efficiency factor